MFPSGTKEVRAHATLLAVLLWTFALISFAATPGYRSITGRLKGTDFVHFYTLGSLVRAGHFDALTDPAALHSAQIALVPASEPEKYLPAYPPQTALVFAPLSALPYGFAYACWIGLTAAVYASAVRYATRGMTTDRWLLVAAAAAFPPFWSLVLHGQSTALPLLAFLLGAIALAPGHETRAGLALGLLAMKPQFALLLPVWLLATRRWRMAAGIVASVLAQVAIVAVVMGWDVWADYAAVVRGLPVSETQLEPKPWLMHSIRAITKLLPFSTALWAIVFAVVAGVVVRTARAPLPAIVQYSILMLASALVSPHLSLYDATVLVLPLPILGRWLAGRRPDLTRSFWVAVYWLAVCYFVPTAAAVRVQGSVLILAWIFWRVTTLALQANTASHLTRQPHTAAPRH